MSAGEVVLDLLYAEPIACIRCLAESAPRAGVCPNCGRSSGGDYR